MSTDRLRFHLDWPKWRPLIKIAIPTLLIVSIPLAIIVLLPVDSSYWNSFIGVFSFSGQLFAIGPLEKVDTAADQGNWFAIFAANFIPTLVLSFFVYRFFSQSYEQLFMCLAYSLLWGVALIESIGFLLTVMLAQLLMGARH